MTREIIISEENNPVNVQEALLKVVQRADIDPERLEKFFDLQIKMQQKQAEQAYNEALAGFQGECPIIQKNKKVKFGSTNYEYAPLDEIVHIIKPYLSKYGLSYTFDIKANEAGSILITTISHKAGHSKDYFYNFDALPDGGAMNQSQRRKSAVTYAKRAGLENALGIVTAGEDDDARRSGEIPAQEDQIEEIRALLSPAKVTEKEFFEKYRISKFSDLTFKGAKDAIKALKFRRTAICSK